MDYEYYYNNARSRYYNACSEVNSCRNRISGLNVQKQKTISTINQLKTDIKNTQNALDGIIQTIKSEEGLNRKLTDVSTKTNQASVNFSGMVHSSSVNSKNLTDVYGDETSKTKTALNSILNTLKAKKTYLSNKLSDLQNQLSRENANLENIKNQIRTIESNLQSWSSTQRSAGYDMEYYRRKMQEAV